jgi:acetyl/propionyl-CoA carboxylase alpha subunit
VEDGTVVSPHYDPMLAKVVAHAPTRREAARALAGALAQARLHGPATNRDLLVRILRHDEFLAGDIDTAFLERHDPAALGAPLADAAAGARHAVAAALGAQARARARAGVLAGLPSGWRNNRSQLQQRAFDGRDGRVEVGYALDRGGALVGLTIDGAALDDVRLVAAGPGEVVLSAGGVERRYELSQVGSAVYVDGPDGSSVFDEVERFPLPGASLSAGSLVAPLPGTVVRVAVGVGDTVGAGDVLVAIEAMKMEHEVRAHGAGTVTGVHVAAGDQVDAGRLLVVVEEDGAGEDGAGEDGEDRA